MIQDGRRIVDKIVAGVLHGRPAGFSRASIVVRDNQMVSRKLRHLKRVPDIAGACRLAEKEQGRSAAVNFVENLTSTISGKRHIGLSQIANPAYDSRQEKTIKNCAVHS
jgi:hypothetical protein